MADFHEMTAAELARILRANEATSVEITTSVLERIDAVEGKIHSYVTVDPESALQMAKEADKTLVAGKGRPLTGIPVAVKDNMCVKGRKATCGSRILENFKPPYNVTVVRRIKEEGMVILGARTWTNSPWAPQPRPLTGAPLAIPGIRT